MAWEEVQAEPPGFVVLSRYRDAPHPRVTFANDFSKRLEPQPGMKVVYARTRIDADSDQVRKLYIGYSDDVSVFLNGQILFRGRSAQNFRDPGFLGIVSADNDAVYLRLKKGANELLLAVSEARRRLGFCVSSGRPRELTTDSFRASRGSRESAPPDRRAASSRLAKLRGPTDTRHPAWARRLCRARRSTVDRDRW